MEQVWLLLYIMSSFKGIIFILFLTIIATYVSAQTTFTANSGNWNVASNWSNGVPTSSVDAIIGAGKVCTVNISNAECASLTLSGNNQETQLIISSNQSLSVSGAVSINAPSSGNKVNSITVEGNLFATSFNMANSTNDNRDLKLILNGGIVTISGNITMNGSANRNSIEFNTTGTVKVGGSLSGGTIAAGSGIMEFSSSGTQTIPSTYTYHNIVVSGAGTKTLGGSEVINNLNISAGTLNVGSNSLTVNGSTTVDGTFTDNNASGSLIFKGQISIGNSGVWNITVAQGVELSGGIANNGSFTSGNGTYRFTTNSQSITGTLTFSGNILLTTASTSITNYGNVTVNGNLEAWNSNNEWVNASSSSLTVAQDLLITGILTATALNNTVIYNNSDTRVAKGTTYHNFTKSGAGSLTLNALTVNGTLTVNAGTFDASAYSVNIDCNGNVTGSGGQIKFAYSNFYIGGNFSFSGTLTIPNATVYYDGSSQTIKNATYYQLYLAGSGVKALSGSTIVSQVLDIAGGVDLSINGYTFEIGGQLTGSGIITGSPTSSLSLTGNSFDLSLSMNQSSSSARTLQNLTINKAWRTVTLSNILEIAGTLTVTAGALDSDGNLVLLSTANGDARIATIPGSNGAAVLGNVTVQKYLPAGSSRRWLHIGSPIQNFNWSQLIDDILISGPGAGGFDVNVSNNPSAFTYEESYEGDCGPNGWEYPTSVSNNPATNQGLKVFFRGDRDPSRLSYNAPAPNSVTLDYVGQINSGTQSMAVTYTNNGNDTWDGWNFVSNPYPSPIDWNAASGWTKNRISGTIYVWNAESGTYATWNGSTGTNGMNSGRVAMGQAFWVKATGSNPVLSMNENVKTATATSGFFKANHASQSIFRITMQQDDLIWDDAVFNLSNEYDRTYQKETGDALKLLNSSINIWSVSSDNQNLVINNYPLPNSSDTVVLGMTSSNGGICTLKFSTDSIPRSILVYLIDEYRGRTIDVRKEKEWKVLINTDPQSYALGRLKVVFINVNLTQISFNPSGDETTKQTKVQWSSSKEIYTRKYEVQYSTDSINFTTIQTVFLNDTLILQGSSYFFLHSNTVNAANYYRLARYNMYGEVELTEIKRVFFSSESTGIVSENLFNYTLYPVPAQREMYFTSNKEIMSNLCKFEIMNVNGQKISNVKYHKKDNVIVFDVSEMAEGIYILNITMIDGEKSSIKFQKR